MMIMISIQQQILRVLVAFLYCCIIPVDSVRTPSVRKRYRRNEALSIMNTNNNNNNNIPLPQLFDSTNLLTKQEEEEEVEQQSQQKQKQPQQSTPTVVIHIGPHKTGTTTIQTFIRDYLDNLQFDNYELPGDWYHRPQRTVNMMGLVKCFNESLPSDCDVESFNDIRKLGEQKSNILITAESLSYPNSNLTILYETLSPYYANENIYIITYYRRYYDWLVSYWNQFNKNPSYENRKTFVEFINDTQRLDRMYNHGPYLFGVSQRYEKYFTNVKYYNMYNMTNNDIIETFFCDAIPNAPTTCEKHRNRPLKERSKHTNVSRKLIYEDLVFTAIRLLNLNFDDNIDKKLLADKVRKRQEEELHVTEYDFDYKICPDETTLQILYDRTMESERKFFPEYFAAQGEIEIKDIFEIDRTKKLCSVNTTAVIQNSLEWQEFFHQLEKEQFLK